MTSTDKFVGYLVSVDCKDIFYQGVVTQIDPNKALIQLKNVFQNGIHCGSKLVDIKTTEIENIEILADPPNAFKLLNPKATEMEQPAAKLSDETNKSAAQPHQQQQHKVSKHIKTSNSQHSMHSHNSNNNHNNSNISPASSSPPYNNNDKYSNKRKAHHNHHNNSINQPRENSNNDGNTMSVDQIEEDFDFEKNLALFDKNKMYEELGHPVLNTTPSTEPAPQLNAYDSLVKQLNSNKQSGAETMSGYHKISVANLFQSQTPSMAAPASANGLLTPNTNGLIANSATSTKTPVINSSSGGRNYRFDEMVLGTGEPVNFQQIQVPYDLGKQYVTDDGFIVPCIDVETRHKLLENSYRYGFNKDRQIESMGRCCTEMAIQLIGGPLRFSIKNNHQKPTILILVNEATLQGTYALCAARMLSIRSCKVHIFVVKSSEKQGETNEYFDNELKLFESTEPVQSTFIKSIDELRTITSVDLILNSVDGSLNSQSWYRSLVKYVENCKASVLSIDPVAEGSAIKSKWCILPMLPMPMDDSCGRVYLCDLGFTKAMFNSVNIKYQSPFGAKFCIPLHND